MKDKDTFGKEFTNITKDTFVGVSLCGKTQLYTVELIMFAIVSWFWAFIFGLNVYQTKFNDRHTFKVEDIEVVLKNPVVKTLTLLGVAMFVGGIFVLFLMKNSKITVKHDQILGNTSFGNKISISVNDVIGVSYGLCDSIIVHTVAGKIRFWNINQKDRAYECIRKLLSNR